MEEAALLPEEAALLPFNCSAQGSPQDDKGTDQSSSTHETGTHETGGSPEPAAIFCQVPGCNAELTHGKTYCIKKRTCTLHMQAESVLLQPDDPNLWRFCQQCGKFEQLLKFDDSKRSCRARLAKRRSGTRAQLLKKGCTAKSDNSSDDAPTASAATARGAGADDGASPDLDQDWLPQGSAAPAAASGGGWFGALSSGMCQHSLSAPLLSLPSGAMVGMTNARILDTSNLMGQQSLASGGAAAGREGRSSAGAGAAAGSLQDGDEDDGTMTDMQLLAALQEMQDGSDPCWSSIQQPADTQQQQQQQQQQGVPALLGAAGSCSSMVGFAAAARAGGAAAAGSDDGLLLPSSGLSMPLQKLQLGGRGDKAWGLGPDSPQQSGGAWGAGASLSAAPTLSAPLPRLGSCFDDAELEVGIALFSQQDDGQQQPQDQQQQQQGQQEAGQQPGNAATAGSGAAAADAGFAFHQQQQVQQQQQASSPALPAISGGAAAASSGAAPAAAAKSPSPAAPARSHSNAASMAASDGGGTAAVAPAATATTTSSGGGSGGGRGLVGSRLKYLIQEVQLELQNCSTNDIENLDEAELSTLLHAALAPPAAGNDSKAGAGSSAGGPAASGAPFAPQTPAAASMQQHQQQQQQQQLMMMSQLGYQQPELQQQVGQVHALQQQVELMRQQLDLVRQASLSANNAASLAAGPQLRQASFDESSLSRATQGAGLSPVQRSVSCTAAAVASAGLLAQQQQQYMLQQQQQQQQLLMQQQMMMQQQQAASMGMLSGVPAMSMAMAESAPMLAMSGSSGCWTSSVQQEMQQIMLQQQQLALQKQQIMRAQEVLRRQVSAPGAVMAAAAAAAGAGAGGSGLGMMPVAATGAMAVPGLGMPAVHAALPQLAMLESQLKQAQSMMTSLLVQQQASS